MSEEPRFLIAYLIASGFTEDQARKWAYTKHDELGGRTPASAYKNSVNRVMRLAGWAHPSDVKETST